MTWLLLALWWVVLPAVPEFVWLHWLMSLVVTSIMALMLARRLWVVPRVHLSVPVVATLVAVASLLVAMRVNPERFPVTERWWEGMTGLAHALFFLVALALVPLPPESVAETGTEEDVASRRFRMLLSMLLTSVLVAQCVVVLSLERNVPRIMGGFSNPNVLGALVAALGLALAAFGRWRPGVLLALSPLLVMVTLTGSRGATASGVLVLLIFAARRNWRWVVGLGAALACLLVFIPNPLWDRLIHLEPEHHFSRPFLWRVALQNVLENPLGIGPAMNRYVFPQHAFDPELPWLVHQRHAVGLTHNVFLTLALEWGWLAGAAGLGLALWTLAKILPRRPVDPLLQGATLGALVMFCELQFDGLEQNAAAFSMFLLFGAITIRRSAGAGRGPPCSGRVASVLLVVAALGLSSQAAVRSQRVARLQDLQEAWIAYQSDEGGESGVRARLERAEEVASDEEVLSKTRFRFEALVHERALRSGLEPVQLGRLVENAWAAAGRASALNPVDPQLARAIADFAYGDLTKGPGGPAAQDRYFSSTRRLLELDPLDVTSRRKLAHEYGREAEHELMEAAFDELFAIEPDDAAAWVLRARYRMVLGDTEGALYAYVRAREAVFNCSLLKGGVAAPRSRKYYASVLQLVDLDVIRLRIAELRDEAYL